VHVTTVPQSLGFLAGQVSFMRERGFEIAAISSPGPELGAFGEREQIATFAVEMPRRITPARDLAAVWRIYRHLRRIGPHVVHSHTPKGGLLGTVSAWLARVPVRIYHIRGLPLMTATGARRRLLRWTERVSCALATRVLCVSRSVARVAVDEGLCPAGKIDVLLSGSGNGVDARGRFDPAARPTARRRVRARAGIPADALVVGFVGRVVRDKGVVELAVAWRELRARFPELHLLVVGDFEQQDPVPDDVRALLHDDPRIHMIGWQTDAAPFYAAMDVVTLPSYREGLPNVPLEGAAMALPVVATDIPGCNEAVADGVTGTLVPPGDAAALAAALERYLESAVLRESHGRAGRERVLREFAREAMWAALHAEYARLLEARGVWTRDVAIGAATLGPPETMARWRADAERAPS
jgi:glycosyltransferase involved in cell wall biosynthesis